MSLVSNLHGEQIRPIRWGLLHLRLQHLHTGTGSTATDKASCQISCQLLLVYRKKLLKRNESYLIRSACSSKHKAWRTRTPVHSASQFKARVERQLQRPILAIAVGFCSCVSVTNRPQQGEDDARNDAALELGHGG